MGNFSLTKIMKSFVFVLLAVVAVASGLCTLRRRLTTLRGKTGGLLRPSSSPSRRWEHSSFLLASFLGTRRTSRVCRHLRMHGSTLFLPSLRRRLTTRTLTLCSSLRPSTSRTSTAEGDTSSCSLPTWTRLRLAETLRTTLCLGLTFAGPGRGGRMPSSTTRVRTTFFRTRSSAPLHDDAPVPVCAERRQHVRDLYRRRGEADRVDRGRVGRSPAQDDQGPRRVQACRL